MADEDDKNNDWEERQPKTRAISEVVSRERPTKELKQNDIGTWPLVHASLERLGPWARHALRLGTLTLLQNRIRNMTSPLAKANEVVEARKLIEALAHMQWEE